MMYFRLVALCLVAACGTERMTSTAVPGPPHSLTVDVPFCNAVVPDWVAFQDGDLPWTRALPVIEGNKTRFRFTFTADRGAIAQVRLLSLGRLTALSVQYGRPEELIIAADTGAISCGPPVKTLLGSVAGIDANDIAAVAAGFGPGALLSAGHTDFALRDIAPGPQVILATRFTRANDATQLTKIILRRTPDLPDSALLAPLDFGSAEAFEPVLATVTLTGDGLDGAMLVSGLATPQGQAFLGAVQPSARGNQRAIVAIPGDRLRESEVQVATLSAQPTDDARRSSSIYFRVPDDQTLTLGAPATMPALSTIATRPSLRLRAAFDDQPDYDRLTSILFSQDSVTVSVAATSAYARLAKGYELLVPDLSGAAGFDSRWALHANTPVFWIASRVGGTVGIGASPLPFPGATSRTGVRFGTFTP